MSDLRIGDEVLVGAGQFSPIIGFSHRAHWQRAEYVRVHTTSGHRVVATTQHVLYIVQDNERVATAAENIVIGDRLPVMKDGQEISSVVTYVEKNVESVGLFNPHTLSGDIVVDGIVCSTYTKHVPMYMAHGLLTPIRAAYRMVSTLSTVVSGGN